MYHLKKLFRIVRPVLLNKYLLTLLIFGAIILFFDDHNLIDRWSNGRKVEKLQKEIEHYKKEIEENRMRINELQSNSENLEKFARETYFMKRPNEDIYIIE